MRTLTEETVTALKGWAKYHAALFVQDNEDGPAVARKRETGGAGELVTVKHFSRDWIMLQFFNFTYKDEFEFIVQDFKARLGAADLADFVARLSQFPPRSDDVFMKLLDEKRPAGYQAKDS